MVLQMKGRKNTKMYKDIITIVFMISFTRRTLEDTYWGIGILSSISSYFSFNLSSSDYFSLFFRFSSSSSNSSITFLFLFGLFGFSEFFSALVPNLINSLWFSYYLTSSIIIVFFYISFNFIYFHVGLLIGYSSRHFVISWFIAVDIFVLFIIGFFWGSNTGIYFVKNLCKIKPNDHTSIFSLLCCFRF